MTDILRRLNLMPVPMFAPDDDGAGGGDTSTAGGGDKGADGAAATRTLTALDDDPGDKTPDPGEWRKMFGDDPDVVKEISRFKTPGDVSKALLEQKKQLRKGAINAEPAPDGAKDPDGLKKWRSEHGIPEDVAGYGEALKDLKFNDADKPMVDGFTEAMHKKNYPPAMVRDVLEFYTGANEAALTDQAAADDEQAKDTRDELRAEWGADFKFNNARARRAAESIGGDWHQYRGPDGRLLGNNAEFIKKLAIMDERVHGDLDAEDGTGGKVSSGTNARIEELRGLMKKDKREWDRHPEWRKEYTDLLSKQEGRKQG